VGRTDVNGFEVDERAMDALVLAFAQCRELGIEVPAAMPLDEPGHQRAAAWYLALLIQRRKDGRE
jgi:hypothetical protein